MTNQVLMLNKSWYPIDLISVFDAICKVWNSRAKFIDPNTYQTYDWEGWITNWDEAISLSKIETDKIIKSPNLAIVKPEIIVCVDYNGIGLQSVKNKRLTPKFSRRNLIIRDDARCSYCGKQLPSDKLNFDHVVPRSQGGRTSWSNVVLSCFKCNTKKGGRTPEEAGMRLLKKPFQPSMNELKCSFNDRIKRKLDCKKAPKSWEDFLGEMYWNVEIQ